MQILTYNVRIEPAEEGGHDVHVPALPGRVTQGETYENAEASALAGEPVPTEPR